MSLSDEDAESANGYSSEDDLDTDLDEVLVEICDEGCNDNKNSDVENLFTRTRSGRIVRT